MNILVTGGTGFLGRSLVRTLQQHGHTGLVTSRSVMSALSAGWSAAIREPTLDGTINQGRFDAIVHLEVMHHVSRPTAAECAEFRKVNVGNTEAWLEWASQKGVSRFVLASSIKAVGSSGYEIDEDALPQQEDPYGRSKSKAEQTVLSWVEGCSTRCGLVLRFAPIYGPGSTANIATFARSVLAGRPSVVGSGDVPKSVVSINNATAAIAHLLARSAPGFDVFNVTDRDTLTLMQLANLISAAGNGQRVRRIPYWLAACASVAGDCVERMTGKSMPLDSRRLRVLTERSGFSPRKLLQSGFVHPESTAEGLERLVNWLTGAASEPGLLKKAEPSSLGPSPTAVCE